MGNFILDKFHFVSHIPGYFAIKNTESIFLNTNENFVKDCGWKLVKNAIGKTDYDVPCKVSEHASEFIRVDKQVVKSKTRKLTIDILNYATGWKMILTEKSPIFNKPDQVIGIYCHSTDVTHFDSFKPYLIINRFDAKHFEKKMLQISYLLSEQDCSLSLTERQEECLFWLVRGKTSKSIAKILRISHRTVEHHIEAIKISLNCHYKSEIIEKAINSGFLSYIPKNIKALWHHSNRKKIS